MVIESVFIFAMDACPRFLPLNCLHLVFSACTKNFVLHDAEIHYNLIESRCNFFVHHLKIPEKVPMSTRAMFRFPLDSLPLNFELELRVSTLDGCACNFSVGLSWFSFSSIALLHSSLMTHSHSTVPSHRSLCYTAPSQLRLTHSHTAP